MAVSGLSCANCYFWQVAVSGAISGDCRRLPPVVAVGLMPLTTQNALSGYSPLAGVFPVMGSGHWCGGFESLNNPWAAQMMKMLGKPT